MMGGVLTVEQDVICTFYACSRESAFPYAALVNAANASSMFIAGNSTFSKHSHYQWSFRCSWIKFRRNLDSSG